MKRRLARQRIASVWRPAEAAFVSRALPANPALLARPREVPGPPRAGPATSRSQYSATELSLLPSLSTSSTPRGVAPPSSPESASASSGPCALLFPLTLLPSSRPESRAPHGGPGLSGLAQTPPRVLLQQPLCLPPPARCLGPGLGVARPDSAHSRGLARFHPASPRRRLLGTRLPPPPSSLTSRARSRALLGERAPGRRVRAPASPGSCQCGDCAGKHGDRGNDPH